MTTYNIEEIEGVGARHGAKLAKAGVKTTASLLRRACTARGRKELASETGLSEKLILKWANIADVMRISGIGPEYSELLEAAGVDTVKELKHRKPENLAAKLAEVNAKKKLTRAVPSSSVVEKWVEQAKGLDPIMKY